MDARSPGDANTAEADLASAEVFLARLRALAAEAAWMRDLDEEMLAAATTRTRFTERAATLTEAVLHALRAHATSVDTIASDTSEFDWGDDVPAAPEPEPPPPAPDTAAIAFVASFALRARQTSLSAADTGDPWQVLAAVDGVGREIARTLDAIERALGLPGTSMAGASTADALKIRRAYVRFGDAVGAATPPASQEVFARLRLVGAAIVKLVSDESYPRMRVGDRHIIRSFHDRILAWLRAEGADTLGGIRLWRDVANMVELIMGINRRPELAAHDGELLRRCLATLASGDTDGARRAAAPLLGREPELDRALRGEPSPQQLRAAMQRALEAITREDTVPEDGRVDEQPFLGDA